MALPPSTDRVTWSASLILGLSPDLVRHGWRLLDDLFVAPVSRGLGVADALISRVREEGNRRGWSVIRWITAEDNYRARSCYDRLAERTRWVTYDIRL